MAYKKRFYILIALIAGLALLYTGSLIFNSDLAAKRSFFVWLDAKTAGQTTKIIINSQAGEIELSKQNKNNLWFVLHDGKVFPARQMRIQDFLDAVTARASWQVRSSSASSHERFGLDNESASRVTLYAETSVILDLLLGNDDYLRNETYFRKYGQNEVRSGDSVIKSYINSQAGSWYNLRLVSNADGGQIDISSVQRVTVNQSEPAAEPHSGEGSRAAEINPAASTQIFTRRNRSWVVSGFEVKNPDIPAIESYIRVILNTEADSFSDTVTSEDPMLNYNRVTLELGSSKVVTIRLSQSDENGRVFAHVTYTDNDDYSRYVYSIPSWSAGRLFMPAESFELQQ